MIKYRLALILFIGIISALPSCAKRDDFLYFVPDKNQEPERNLFCNCPSGFNSSEDETHCVRETTVTPLMPSNPSPILEGDVASSYYGGRSVYVPTSLNQNWPFHTFERPWDFNRSVIDSLGSVLKYQVEFPTLYWKDRVTGPQRISIKGTHSSVWYTKTFCVQTPDVKDYVIHVGSDNNWKVKVDGQSFADCNGDYCFINGLFLGQKLESGKHLIELKYMDLGGQAAAWFEVYNNTLDEVRTAKTDSDLNLLYTTKSLIGDSWDYDGEICPAGYVYDVCEPQRKCIKIERKDCF